MMRLLLMALLVDNKLNLLHLYYCVQRCDLM